MTEHQQNDKPIHDAPDEHAGQDKRLRVPLTEAVITLILVVVVAMVVWWPSPESASATNAVYAPAERWTSAEPIEPMNQSLWSVEPEPAGAEAQPADTTRTETAAPPPTTVVVQQAAPDPAVEQKLEELSKLTDSQTRAMAQLLGDLETQRRAQKQQAETIQRLTEALSKAAAQEDTDETSETDQTHRAQVVEALFDLKATLDHAQQRAAQNEAKLAEMGQRLAELSAHQAQGEAQAADETDGASAEADEAARSIAELRMHLDTARQSEVAQWQDLHQSINTLEQRLASLAERIDVSSQAPTPEPTATGHTIEPGAPTNTRTQTTVTVTDEIDPNHSQVLTHVVIALINGHYEDATGYFSPAHRQRVTADGIAEAMDGIRHEAGKFAGIISRQRLPMNLDEGTAAYRVVAKTTYHKRVSFTVTIGPSGKVDGLFARLAGR